MIRFGVEHETFLFRTDGGLPSRDDIDRLFNTLLEIGHRAHAVDDAGAVLGVAQTTNYGPVVIKTDFCSHILEVAYPPIRTAGELVVVAADVETSLSAALEASGLQRRVGAALEQVPEDTVVIPCNADSERRIARLLARKLPRARFSHRMFDAAICATQVHLDVLDESFFALMPGLYSVEYLIPLLFSRGSVFAGQHAHCVRPLIWRDCFVEDYLAHGFPDPVPASPTDHRRLIEDTPDFIRDYTFIAPRPALGSVEFRSACAQDSMARILELVALRLAAHACAKEGLLAERRGARAHFYQVCERGDFNYEWAAADLAALRAQAGRLPSDLVLSLRSVCDRLQRVLLGTANKCGGAGGGVQTPAPQALTLHYSESSQIAAYLEAEWSDFLHGAAATPETTARFGPVTPVFYQTVVQKVARWAGLAGLTIRNACDVGGATGRLSYELACQLECLEAMMLVEPAAELAAWARKLLLGEGCIDVFPTVKTRTSTAIAPPEALPPLAASVRFAVREHPLDELDAHLQFDLVCCLNVVDRVAQPASLVANLTRHVRTGGMLVLASPLSFDPRFTPDRSNWIENLRALLPDAQWQVAGEDDLLYEIRRDVREKISYLSQTIAALKR